MREPGPTVKIGSLRIAKAPDHAQVTRISRKSKTYAFANLITSLKALVYDLEEFWFAFIHNNNQPNVYNSR
jgi:hypothetical protein